MVLFFFTRQGYCGVVHYSEASVFNFSLFLQQLFLCLIIFLELSLNEQFILYFNCHWLNSPCFWLHPFCKLLPSGFVTLPLVDVLIFLAISSSDSFLSTASSISHSIWGVPFLLHRSNYCTVPHVSSYITMYLSILYLLLTVCFLQEPSSNHSIASSTIFWVCVCVCVCACKLY